MSGKSTKTELSRQNAGKANLAGVTITSHQWRDLARADEEYHRTRRDFCRLPVDTQLADLRLALADNPTEVELALRFLKEVRPPYREYLVAEIAAIAFDGGEAVAPIAVEVLRSDLQLDGDSLWRVAEEIMAGRTDNERLHSQVASAFHELALYPELRRFLKKYCAESADPEITELMQTYEEELAQADPSSTLPHDVKSDHT